MIGVEGLPVEGPLPVRLFRRLINAGPTEFLRSACCHAPVFQTHESWTEVYPVQCTVCFRELGAPGLEDLEEP